MKYTNSWCFCGHTILTVVCKTQCIIDDDKDYDDDDDDDNNNNNNFRVGIAMSHGQVKHSSALVGDHVEMVS